MIDFAHTPLEDLVKAIGASRLQELHPRYRLASHCVRAARIMLRNTNSREGAIVALFVAVPSIVSVPYSPLWVGPTGESYKRDLAVLLRRFGADWHWPKYGIRAFWANKAAYQDALHHFGHAGGQPYYVPGRYHTSQAAASAFATELQSLLNREGERT